MTGDGDRFEVRLGRMRSPSGARKVEGFFRKVSKGARKLGRGGGRGRSQRSAARTQFYRRVLVKVRVVSMDPKGRLAQKLHLNYVERDGTGPDGEPSRLYDRHGPDADKQAFLERGAEDRHQFRIILSPEDAGELSSLTEFTRDLTAQMERDLGTRLDWVAVDHYDTGQPHTHLIISGKRDDGRDLVIPRDFISRGLRERAQALVELELGPVPETDGRARMARMVGQARFTEIDRALIRRARESVVDLSGPHRPGDGWRRQIERMRLGKLQGMALAEPLGKGRWRLADHAETDLRRMGERGDVIKAMHRAMRNQGVARTLDAGAIFEDRLASLETGRIVTVAPPNRDPRRADHVIAEIAAANEGRYSSALHMAHDKSARPEFVAAHIRRLEALRRVGHATRVSDGSWRVPEDYLDRAGDYEKAATSGRPVEIRVHSSLRLAQMKSAMGATWLDEHLRDFDDAGAVHGFAGEVEAARIARRQFLMQQGLINHDHGRLSQSVLDRLEVNGVYTQAVERPSGRYAVIERTRDFTLVPWRDVMDRNLGKSVSGLVREGGISWTLTRGRGIG